MKITYTKDEIQEVMQKHFSGTHYGKDAKRDILAMTMSSNQLSIEMAAVEPEEKL